MKFRNKRFNKSGKILEGAYVKVSDTNKNPMRKNGIFNHTVLHEAAMTALAGCCEFGWLLWLLWLTAAVAGCYGAGCCGCRG